MEPRAMRELLVARGSGASAELRATLGALPLQARDPWLDSVLGLDAFEPDEAALPRGCVPYLPCSVEVILRVVDAAEITSRDVFVDVGSGVGRVAALTHWLTGARAVGLEIQSALVERARALADDLRMSGFTTIEADAVESIKSVSLGTVFFLYCPFSGARLERVLEQLEDIAKTHAIRIAAVQLPAFERNWLELVASDAELSVYRSRVFA